jgi:hypothetical protein
MGGVEMEDEERGAMRRCGRPPVRVVLDFFHPSSEGHLVDTGVDPAFVILQSPIVGKHVRSA